MNTLMTPVENMVKELHFKLKVGTGSTTEDVEQAIEEEAMDIFGSALDPIVVELEDLWMVMLQFEGTPLEDEDPEYMQETAEEFMDAVAYHLDGDWIAVEVEDEDDF